MTQTASPDVLSLHILVRLTPDRIFRTQSAVALFAVEFNMDPKLQMQKLLVRKAHLAQNLNVASYLYAIKAT